MYRQMFIALYTVIKTSEVQKKTLSVWVQVVKNFLMEWSPQGPAKRMAACSQCRGDAPQVCHSRQTEKTSQLEHYFSLRTIKYFSR